MFDLEGNDRFKLVPSGDHEQWNIIDIVESNENNAIVIYNDLGSIYFSSAPQLCELLNDLYHENQELKEQLNFD